VLTEDLLREVFELDAKVIADPVAGTPLVVPIGPLSHSRGGAPLTHG
jgi:iron complex transport system ATP-binding protein